MSYPDTPEGRAKQKATRAKWYQEKKLDPQWRQKRKENTYAYRADPVNRERILSKRRVRVTLTVKEHVIEKYLCDAVEARGGFCPKFVDAGRRGAPDRLVIVPGNPVQFVELKRPEIGQIASWQKRYHEQLRACGQPVWVLSTIEQVDQFIASLNT